MNQLEYISLRKKNKKKVNLKANKKTENLQNLKTKYSFHLVVVVFQNILLHFSLSEQCHILDSGIA